MSKSDYEQIDNIPGGDHIRILSLAASENYDDPIHVSLWTVKLADAPSYDALSYCWGDASNKRLIYCDGKPFQVTPNLESALRRLRQPHVDNVLWIDAICINQADLDERTHQVTLMHRIYQSAVTVIVWLGTGGGGSHLVFPACERMNEFYGDLLREDSAYLFSHEFERRSRADKRNILKEKLRELKRRKAADQNAAPGTAGTVVEEEEEEVLYPTKEEVTATVDLVNRPWFTRCWVLQEISLASDAVVLCGRGSISWDQFFLGFVLITTFNDGHLRIRGSETFSRNNLTLTSVVRSKLHSDDSSVGNQGVDLLWLLWQVQYLEVTDSRDKVNSILGLIEPGEARKLALVPDYTISVEECYKRAALAIMSYSRNLDLLVTERNLESDLNLPSWVPDWSFPQSPSPMLFCREDDRQGLTQLGYNQFRASGPAKYENAVKVQGNVLQLSGYVIDVISELEEVLTVPQLEQSDNMNNVSSINQFSEYWKRQVCDVGAYLDGLVQWEKLAFSSKYAKYPTGEDAETVFAMTLCAGNVDGTEVALTSFREWRKLLRGPRAVSFLGRFNAKSQVYQSFVTIAAFKDAVCHGRDKTYTSSTEISLYRRLARTRKGYLALVPRQSALGDRIALCEGGKMPFVLRRNPEKDEYELVGPSYIHGLMHGEAWNPSIVRDIRIV